MKFKNIYKETKDNVESSMLSLWTPGRHRMRAAIKDLFEREPLLAEPIFQSMFPWKTTSDPNWQQYLHQDVIAKLQIGCAAGGKDPYQHQSDSWKELKNGNSIVVTSGTGSGKTECFMHPVISDLYEQKQNGEDRAVEAIFLYPLNALMEDQKERLGKACEATGLRFAVYNGSLPESICYAKNSNYAHAEVRSRANVRNQSTTQGEPSLPHILLTNPSMLEYMMVRRDDQPIFERSKGKLRWIIIDETHTYTGSAAVELAYLIKRVLNAFGVKREDVRFVCTSATIGDPTKPQQLIDFIETIIGKYTVGSGKYLMPISGNRILPVIAYNDIQLELNARNITITNAQQVSDLRNEVNQRPMSLAEIWQSLTSHPLNDIEAALDLLDNLCDININGNFVLMLRGNFFMRSISGLYACVNHNCNNTTLYRNTGFEYLTTNKGDGYCPHCGAPLLEIVQCGDCKEFLLMCEENNNSEIRYCGSESEQNSDYITTDTYNNYDDDDSTDGGQVIDGWEKKYFSFYGNGRTYAKPHPNYMESKLAFIWNGNDLKSVVRGVPYLPWVELQNNRQLYCPTCSSGSGFDGKKFKPFRLSANWLNTTIAPALLLEGSSVNNIWGKYIAFTDSRQGTAIHSKKFNIESERAYARSHLVESLSTPGSALTISQVADCIFCQQIFDHIDDEILNNKSNRYNNVRINDMDAYKTALVRSIIARRPIKSSSSENLGLITLTYPQINNIPLPNCWRQNGFSIDDWHAFLKISIDYVIRLGNHFQSPSFNGDEMEYLRDTYLSTPYDLDSEWPQVKWNNAGVRLKQHRLVLLLCAALGIDTPNRLANEETKINQLLNEAKLALASFLTKVNQTDEYANTDIGYIGRYYLDLSLNSNKCIVRRTESLWICPASNYLLDTIFKGYSPHIHGCVDANNINRYRCSNVPDIRMPLYNPGMSFEKWFATDHNVAGMLNNGVWNDRHKYAYQPKEEGFLTAEHSGQQNRDLLADYTVKFKANPHKLNLLQCSTTMEMGVDIGDIDMVLMTNIPPTAANYLQRAGRAGRMGQSRSLAFCLCPNTSIGIMAFKDPMNFITSCNIVYLPVESKIIIQRHINSFFMHEFVSQNLVSTNNVDEWLNNGGISYDFEIYLTNIQNNQNITVKYAEIFGNAIGYSVGLNSSKQKLCEIRDEYQSEHNALLQEYNNTNDRRKRAAIEIQLLSFEEQQLKSYLSGKQYLPNANFPTGIVEFNHIDGSQSEDLERLKRHIVNIRGQIAQANTNRMNLLKNQMREKQLDLQKLQEKTLASREIKIALSEYAPGQDVVINERNIKSEGIEWKNSYQTGNPLKYIYKCNCGRYEYSNNANLTNCQCGQPFRNILTNTASHYTMAIEPVRFRSDANRRNNIKEDTEKRYYRVETILTHVDWRNPIQGPMCELVGNGDGQGEIVFYNKGIGLGFKLCLDCGRMDIELPLANANPNAQWPHTILTYSGRGNKNCIRRNNIKNNVVISGAFPTSYVSMRFREAPNSAMYVGDKDLLYSLGVVLRIALAHTIGIGVDEIDFDIRNEITNGHNYMSLYIYDTMKGGCDYSTQMLDPLICNKVFDEAKRMLASYPCNCEKNTKGACVDCLVDRNSQRYERYLSKYKVMSWFAKQSLPLTPSTIIPNTPAVPITLRNLLVREICDSNVNGLVLFVDAAEMNIGEWARSDGTIGGLLYDCLRRGKKVTIKVSNVPSVSNGNTLSEIYPFVDLPDKLQNYKVEAIQSLEFYAGAYTALIVEYNNTPSHYFVEQPDVLPFSEMWGENCNALFGNNNVPVFASASFPTMNDVIQLATQQNNIVRSGQIQNVSTTVGRLYADVIVGQVLQNGDDNEIRNILGGKKVNVTFSDSYVNSALASLMLTYLVKSIKDKYGFNIGNVDLQFQSANRNCINPRWNDYTFINFPDQDEQSADDYTQDLFDNVLNVIPNFSAVIPDHYRWLRFQPVGENCYVEIRPDYGIAGGWQSNRKYKDKQRLDANTPVSTKASTTVVYYVLINKS